MTLDTTRFVLERAMRFELTTLTLARLCSTPELRPHSMSGEIRCLIGGCKREKRKKSRQRKNAVDSARAARQSALPGCGQHGGWIKGRSGDCWLALRAMREGERNSCLWMRSRIAAGNNAQLQIE